MNRRALIAGAAAAGAAGIAAALLLGEDDAPAPAQGGLMFPGLAERLAQAAKVEIRRNDAALTLVRRDDRWVIGERNDYPALDSKLRELLTGLTELRLIEPRATDLAGWARLGVDDPASNGSTAAFLRVLDGQGRPIAELYIGRRRVRVQGGLPESVYVRRGGETQAWLAEGRVPAEADPASWMDREVANFPAERILGATIRRVGERPLTVARLEPGAPLVITDPADPPSQNRAALDEVMRGLEYLTFMDAVPAAESRGEALGESTFSLTEELRVTVWASKLDQFLFLRLQAEGGVEATVLNRRWSGWAYQVGVWKEKSFVPTLEDLTRESAG